MGEYSLKDAIRQFLNQSQIKGGVNAMRVQEAWENIMGKTIARYTEKIEIHGSTLYITTHVAALKNELVFKKDSIRDLVNEAIGEKVIKEVVIR